MTLGEHLTTVLSEDPTVAGLVGTKIFRVKGPTGVQAPCVMFSMRLVERLDDLSGDIGIAKHNVDFNCFGDDAGVSEQIADAIIECLRNYTGTREGVEIRNISISSDDDDDFSEDVDMFRHIVTAVVTHKKTT